MSNEENVALDELGNQVSPQLRGYLQCMYSQAQQYLDDILNVVIDLFGFEEFLLVLTEDSL